MLNQTLTKLQNPVNFLYRVPILDLDLQPQHSCCSCMVVTEADSTTVPIQLFRLLQYNITAQLKTKKSIWNRKNVKSSCSVLLSFPRKIGNKSGIYRSHHFCTFGLSRMFGYRKLRPPTWVRAVKGAVAVVATSVISLFFLDLFWLRLRWPFLLSYMKRTKSTVWPLSNSFGNTSDKMKSHCQKINNLITNNLTHTRNTSMLLIYIIFIALPHCSALLFQQVVVRKYRCFCF